MKRRFDVGAITPGCDAAARNPHSVLNEEEAVGAGDVVEVGGAWRAVERGEVSPELDVELAADLVVGPIAVALFFKGGRLDPRMVGPMVDLALRGILVSEPA